MSYGAFAEMQVPLGLGESLVINGALLANTGKNPGFHALMLLCTQFAIPMHTGLLMSFG